RMSWAVSHPGQRDFLESHPPVVQHVRSDLSEKTFTPSVFYHMSENLFHARSGETEVVDGKEESHQIHDEEVTRRQEDGNVRSDPREKGSGRKAEGESPASNPSCSSRPSSLAEIRIHRSCP
ncbi:hypothetical protein ACFL0Q_08655, partial [Thermodesulfobacteriota bacterium]